MPIKSERLLLIYIGTVHQSLSVLLSLIIFLLAVAFFEVCPREGERHQFLNVAEFVLAKPSQEEEGRMRKGDMKMKRGALPICSG